MVIKKKDGSVFKVQKPNPIMKTQDFWDDGSKFVLHNFTREKEISKPQEPPKFTPMQDIIPEEIIVPIKETPIPTKKKKTNSDLAYCLPSIHTEIDDPLYDEKKSILNFGIQFTLGVKVMTQTDLMVQLLVENDKIEKASIIYLPEQRRWWKVESKEVKDYGVILNCTPSSLQPSFAI